MPTKIEWTEETWNPVTGCTPVSPGCANCYAKRMAKRLAGRCGYPEAPREFDVTLHPDRLDQPLRWKKPRKVFVCSMSDLFHHAVSDNFAESVFNVMLDAPQHTFQVLTKRPERMAKIFSLWNFVPDNVWLGVTCENQEQFYARYPYLAECSATVRFVSLEPLLGPIDMGSATPDWVIVGGETGPGARPMHPDWARGLRDQCVEAHVPFFYKGAGTATLPKGHLEYMMLDGREWSEYPLAFADALKALAYRVNGPPVRR